MLALMTLAIVDEGRLAFMGLLAVAEGALTVGLQGVNVGLQEPRGC